MYLQRTRLIPDELLPYFEQVNAVKSKADFNLDLKHRESETSAAQVSGHVDHDHFDIHERVFV